MLYQLSYASAAQTNELYQRGIRIARGFFPPASNSQAKVVENPPGRALACITYLAFVSISYAISTIWSTEALTDSLPGFAGRLTTKILLLFYARRMGKSESHASINTA